MCIGTRGQEEIWIAFMPNSLMDGQDLVQNMSLVDGAASSMLVTRHAYMVVIFFAGMLSQMQFQDIDCNTAYPELITHERVCALTDIL